MAPAARFLHITDTHLKPGGSEYKLDERKVDVQLEPQTREIALEGGLERLAERLKDARARLDGVIFSGDALSGGTPGGDKLLLELMLRHLEPFGITAKQIVAVPGNHDVPRGVAPSSQDRYEQFLAAWRDAGCITPWIDGIDAAKPDFRDHILLGPDNEWAVLAVNSSNWSHVSALPKNLLARWADIPKALAPTDAVLRKTLTDELDSLSRYDMARVSPAQLAAVRHMLAQLPPPTRGRQLRVMALHHHLRSPSLAEEVKPFSDLSNLEQVRTFIAEQGIRVVLHGHKHAARVHSDFIESAASHLPHKVLMVAGSSFSASDHADAMRLLSLTGLPWVPTLDIEPIALPRQGLGTAAGKSTSVRLWSPTDSAEEAPVAIQGTNFDEVYARVVVAAREEAKERTLIVQLDLSDFTTVKRLPEGYPTKLRTTEERSHWLADLVNWWQLPQSQLQERVPYIHGARLHNYASNLNQIDRVRSLLKTKQTTRAIALLVDPSIDFKDVAGAKNDFASFCLVQFTRRDEGGAIYVDCVGYYRTQEMVQWWPINVAELLHLQTEVAKGFAGRPGRITTVTACARSAGVLPTHVAMPVIDRWLDQTPEKYFILASTLLSGKAMTEDPHGVLEEWLASLDELAEAATTVTPDGGPVVAIEGPARLAKYLLSGAGPKIDECKKLAGDLEEIARMGRTPPSADQHSNRHAWGERLSRLLRSCVTQCRAIVQ
ncbi:metallophosphoesterase [Variovorax boronicumulans]|uniref:metallophosphoesterase n=1 Tax=Variovorax boronicumulans TaxID=436515 RepID=UPI001C584C40